MAQKPIMMKWRFSSFTDIPQQALSAVHTMPGIQNITHLSQKGLYSKKYFKRPRTHVILNLEEW